MDAVEPKNEGRLVPPAKLPVLPLLLTDCIKALSENEGESTVGTEGSLLGNEEKPFFNVIAGF